MMLGRRIIMGAMLAAGVGRMARAQGSNPLPSWNDTDSRRAILEFVQRASTGADALPAGQRVAVFDNDGTLWSEQPVYNQAAFAIDRLRVLARSHPEWKTKQPYAAFLAGDMRAIAAAGMPAVEKLVMTTHAGTTTDAFAGLATEWLATARHPRFKRPYTDCVYQPMLELLDHLRANGFRTFIVSGGGIEFMCPWTERVYGIPPDQVIGSTIRTRLADPSGKPVLMREAAVDAVNDGPGKPVGISRFIGRQPVFAAGNSDGDLQMLQWTTMRARPGFGLIVHHTDAEREYAYDRQSHFGRLDKALTMAAGAGWTVVDMKRDWKRIFPFD